MMIVIIKKRISRSTVVLKLQYVTLLLVVFFARNMVKHFLLWRGAIDTSPGVRLTEQHGQQCRDISFCRF